MDHNPDTINKLIGAKVTSYRELKPEVQTSTENTSMSPSLGFYESLETEGQKEGGVNSRREDAYAYLTLNTEDTYAEESEDDKSIHRGAAKLIAGGPKKKWLGVINKPKFIQKAQKRKHYDSARKDIVSGVVGKVAQHKGLGKDLTDDVKRVANAADSVVAGKTRDLSKRSRNWIKAKRAERKANK